MTRGETALYLQAFLTELRHVLVRVTKYDSGRRHSSPLRGHNPPQKLHQTSALSGTEVVFPEFQEVPKELRMDETQISITRDGNTLSVPLSKIRKGDIKLDPKTGQKLIADQDARLQSPGGGWNVMWSYV